jgi:triosephosphate isomerase|tara:strand:- start:15012 stop:15617 length:606 start_codon:yes stop_codon:yes gene_type:complete
MLIINLKTYKFGNEEIAKIIGRKGIIACQAMEIKTLSKFSTIYAQHVDSFEPGRHTGYILPESVKKAGAKGVILNHSEHKLSLNVLKATINRCKKLNLKTLICVSSLGEVKKIKKLKPSMIAYEARELIGTGKSVSKSKPKIVENFVKSLKNTKIIPLCGAGISDGEDVRIAKQLGCKGVLVASAIAKAKNPKKIIKDLKW